MLAKKITAVILSHLLSYAHATLAMDQKLQKKDYLCDKLGVAPTLKFMSAHMLAGSIEENKYSQCIPEELTEYINLIKQVINLDASDKQIKSILFNCINNSDFQLEPKSKTFNNIIKFLIRYNKIDLVKLLLNNVDLNKYTSLLSEYLRYAAQHLSLDVITLLLSKGADPNAKDDHGNTVLLIIIINMHACRKKSCIDTINLLLENGSDVNSENRYGTTPLIKACFKGEKDIVELLVKNGAIVDPESISVTNALQITDKYIKDDEKGLVDAFISGNYPNRIKKTTKHLNKYKAIRELLINKILEK